ncbi:MAG: GTP cyclohydrolase [Deltaproteobacteria bacterium RIFCSPLOWO2_02_FULL_44_10]|nr:MAG: GTP cyclohydrolase [Deltaproteobacteria bacterium RIFCSPHIGHO2_02_FULL_44_16]OGQ46956.1 MAG: GTP cyclohydrolase [Deltaproteobacteria bacterium RIFCSPLOWO2_02_FULL_44_10]
MKDVQNQRDDRQIPIDKVGVKGIRYPISLLDKHEKEQHTIASINMYVDLPHHFKGTHMSRFIEILNEYRREIHIDRLPEILAQMRKSFDASSAHIEIRFPYFIAKSAPVTKSIGMIDYECFFTASSTYQNDDSILGVNVPIMTLCPCSKEISEYGAHNQRGIVSLEVRQKKMIWIEDLIEIVEKAASSPIYSLLKRPDEKFVTEQSYNNPKFVEDVVRDIALTMNEHDNVSWYRISAENFESIHNHSAYAFVEKDKKS